jgi:diadenosine tetraphosphate (Ap4A) HIT family hydrolase
MVESCRTGQFPRLIGKVSSGWLIFGEKQVVTGYCLLLPDPVVPHLNAMEAAHRSTFLNDMAVLGDGLLRVTGALRINYEMLGNLEPALHCHLFPRYADEPSEFRTRPIWFYDWDKAPVAGQLDLKSIEQAMKQLCIG